MNRDEVQGLLPFLANETLSGDERADVESALAGDAELRAELDALRAIRGTMQDEQEFSPGEMGLARLMREVGEETRVAAAAPTRKPWMWQAAAGVLLAVVVGQTAFQMGTSDDIGDSDRNFTLASGGAPAEATVEGPLIAVAFTPTMTEADLRALLTEAGVALAGGPTEDGLYYVTPTAGVALDDASTSLVGSDFVEMLELP